MEAITVDATGVRLLLACGHYAPGVHADSSILDFPEDALWCPECGDERQMHPRLQTMIYEERG